MGMGVGQRTRKRRDGIKKNPLSTEHGPPTTPRRFAKPKRSPGRELREEGGHSGETGGSGKVITTSRSDTEEV